MFIKNGRCKECRNVLRRGGSRKNYTYKCEGYCYTCILNMERSLLSREENIKNKEAQLRILEEKYNLPENQELIRREKKLKEGWEELTQRENELSAREEELKPQFKILEKTKARVYLNVSYKDKDEAKELGARWECDKGKWYAPDDTYTELINRFK